MNMKLEIRLIQDFATEAALCESRDTVIVKAKLAGYKVLWSCDGD